MSSTYNLAGTNTGGCSSSQVIDVVVFSSGASINSPIVICSGNNATLTVNCAASYTWGLGSQSGSIVLNPLVSTNYSVSKITYSNHLNCSGSASVSLLVNPTPTVSALASQSVMCKCESFILTASGANTDSWNNASGSRSLTVTSSLITALNYTLSGSNTQGCSSFTTVSVKVNGCAGVLKQGRIRAVLLFSPIRRRVILRCKLMRR